MNTLLQVNGFTESVYTYCMSQNGPLRVCRYLVSYDPWVEYIHCIHWGDGSRVFCCNRGSHGSHSKYTSDKLNIACCCGSKFY